MADSLDDMLDEWSRLEAQISEIQGQIGELKEIIVERHSPVAVGDEVDVTAMSHKGKRMKVTYITVRRDMFCPCTFSARGFVLNKSGAPSMKSGESNFGPDGRALGARET